MDKLRRIFLAIIIILTIALGIMTFSYFKMRNVAKENLDLYLEAENKITTLIKENAE